MALFLEAMGRVVEAVGEEAWIVAGIRGPFLMGSQLRGVEPLLMDLIDRPDWVGELLAFTTEVGLAFGRALIEVGAHAISIGEATCSPDFINPVMYRQVINPHHARLIQGLKEQCCEASLVHICGQALPIVADVAAAGAAVMDVDWQVDLQQAEQLAGSMTLRGNLDPVEVLLYGSPDLVAQKTKEALEAAASGGHFILGSGCDVPPDTPPENIQAMVQTARSWQRAAGNEVGCQESCERSREDAN